MQYSEIGKLSDRRNQMHTQNTMLKGTIMAAVKCKQHFWQMQSNQNTIGARFVQRSIFGTQLIIHQH